jgi:hypothetical protein
VTSRRDSARRDWVSRFAREQAYLHEHLANLVIVLDATAVAELERHYTLTRDRASAEMLVRSVCPWIAQRVLHAMVRKRIHSVLDAFQDAVCNLWSRIEDYDCSRGKFTTFTSAILRGSIGRSSVSQASRSVAVSLKICTLRSVQSLMQDHPDFDLRSHAIETLSGATDCDKHALRVLRSAYGFTDVTDEHLHSLQMVSPQESPPEDVIERLGDLLRAAATDNALCASCVDGVLSGRTIKELASDLNYTRARLYQVMSDFCSRLQREPCSRAAAEVRNEIHDLHEIYWQKV